MQVPDRFYRKFADRELRMRSDPPEKEDVAHTRAALAMCENIDWNVGRLLRTLDALRIAEKTIVIYFSDNGPNGWRWNDGMKGRKGSTDEGGVRSPCLLRWSGHLPAGRRIPQIAGAIDLLPTLADLAGVSLPTAPPLDGVSLEPLLTASGNAAEWPDRMIFSLWAGKASVRTQRYRVDDEGHLFDMTNDPGQRQDVSSRMPEVAARLTSALRQWKAESLAALPPDDRPFPVGHPPQPRTMLPARDGVPHGGVKRSAPAPNCSFFTHWTSPADSITWDIEVATAGRYEAVLYYTCPATDVGSTIELSFGDRRMTARVTEPHDPPLCGAENDRVPRHHESYVKEFRPLRLGMLDLTPGRSLLRLRALTVPGRQVMDVRMAVLTLCQAPESKATESDKGR